MGNVCCDRVVVFVAADFVGLVQYDFRVTFLSAFLNCSKELNVVYEGVVLYPALEYMANRD